MKIRLLVQGLLLLVLAVGPAAAELRQWTDENGVKHFSNKEKLPPGVSVERAYEEKESRAVKQSRPQPVVPKTPQRSEQERAKLPLTPAQKAAVLKQIRDREARQRAVFERIYSLRRYVKQNGKAFIEAIRRLNGEIAALEKSAKADSGAVDRLKEERAVAQERLYNENLRTRKGLGEVIKEHKQLGEEIKALKKKLE
jgi:uncharacterized protein (UPF0335 family)